jgi:hypothetical protein
MQRKSCPHCVMPLGRFTLACSRCGKATPFAGTLPWLGAATVGLVVLLGFAAVAWTRIGDHAPEAHGPVPDSAITLAPAPPRGLAAVLDSAEAAHASARQGGSAGASPPAPARRVPNVPDTTGIEVNGYPPEPHAIDGVLPGEKRRAALEALLRRGLADSLRERSPGVVQVFVGRAFFRQPPQFRNPLMKALDVAWTDPSGSRRTFELWWDTFNLGVYARDTFTFGKWYYELR